MRRTMISCLILLFLMTVAAQAQWRSKTHDMYNALQKPADIKIDGNLDDKEGWEGVFETVKGTDGKYSVVLNMKETSFNRMEEAIGRDQTTTRPVLL